MSTIPSSISPAVHLAGSVSGTQRRDSQADRTAEAAAQQRLPADRHELAARSLGDIGQTDQSADRDADGGREHEPDVPPDPAADEQPQPPGTPAVQRAADAAGERGRLLDCDA
jgi:hypothetical protein